MTNIFQVGLEAAQRGDFAKARESFERTLWAAHQNLGLVLSRLRDPRAETHYRAALKQEPNSAETAYALALWLLREGRYEEAWPLHEARRHAPGLGLAKISDRRPEWAGEDLRGKRILVVSEQGYGDQIMFARFFPEIQALGAEYAYLTTPPLLRLLGGRAQADLLEFDVWAHQQSLPRWLGARLDNLPQPFRIPVRHRGGGGVGVVPSGSAMSPRDSNRSLDDDASERLLALGRDLRPEATGARDFLETAELIADLDIVITVDTAVAHLAGSMGAPTRVLLPGVGADWRWMHERTDSPWYPSVTLYRQTTQGDWSEVIERAAADL